MVGKDDARLLFVVINSKVKSKKGQRKVAGGECLNKNVVQVVGREGTSLYTTRILK